jgi:ribulose-5-phosphate 4-epimerase/fuculose-1-phosphate aldolase
VEHFDILGNYLSSRGGVKASSESLTHAAIYQTVPAAKYVAHAHHRGLWEKWNELGMLTTSPDAEYGTPEIALQVRDVAEKAHGPMMIALLGHRDGIITWGPDPDSIISEFKQLLEIL